MKEAERGGGVGDVLENSKVRVCGRWEKSVPRKTFILAWNIPKWPLERGWGCTYSCSHVNVSFCFPKIPFSSRNCPFMIPNCPFIFQKSNFVPWNCLFVFQNCLHFYLLCASFWKILFFPTDCTVSTSCSELLREIIFHFFLFCFLLELFLGQLHHSHHPRFRGRCWMHDLQNGPYNYQETMFLGRWGIEHANEKTVLKLFTYDRNLLPPLFWEGKLNRPLSLLLS